MNETQRKSGLYFIKLLSRYLFFKLNFQHILFFSVFMTFVLGDAITASFMMDIKGIGAEYSSMAKFAYANFGLAGLMTAKFMLIIFPIFIISIVDKKCYWVINGILIALTFAGIMATHANLHKLADSSYMNPIDVILIYFILLLILILTGTILDHIYSEDEHNWSISKYVP